MDQHALNGNVSMSEHDVLSGCCVVVVWLVCVTFAFALG